MEEVIVIYGWDAGRGGHREDLRFPDQTIIASGVAATQRHGCRGAPRPDNRPNRRGLRVPQISTAVVSPRLRIGPVELNREPPTIEGGESRIRRLTVPHHEGCRGLRNRGGGREAAERDADRGIFHLSAAVIHEDLGCGTVGVGVDHHQRCPFGHGHRTLHPGIDRIGPIRGEARQSIAPIPADEASHVSAIGIVRHAPPNRDRRRSRSTCR